MSGHSNDQNPAAWHPINATAKWHEFVMAQKQLAHTSAFERNREHEETLRKLRDTEAGPPQQP